MKDQYTIDDGESKQEKWNRGLDIFIESVIKPDPALRQSGSNTARSPNRQLLLNVSVS